MIQKKSEEVNGNIRRALLKDKLNIGWRRTEAKDYINVIQCYN